MRKVRFWLLGLWVSIVLPLSANEPVQRHARVTAVSGQVLLTRAADPKHPQTIGTSMPVQMEEGDILDTGLKSQAKVMFDNETVFHLQAGSRFKPKKLFARNTQLEFAKGAVLVKVRPAAQGAGFILKMPNAVVAVHSADFAAETGNGLTQIGVFQGHVIVAGAWGHEHVKLGPDQETKVTLSAVPQVPHKIAHFKAAKRFFLSLRTR